MGTSAPVVHLRQGLRVAGYGDDEVRALLRRGELATVRRGAYVSGPLPDDNCVRHRAEIRAASRQLCADAVISHVSAVVLRGWDVWGLPLTQVRVTRARRSGGRLDPGVHVYAAPLRAEEIEFVDGIPVTSAARIVTDVARTVPFEQAVVVADCALATGAVTPAELADAIARQKGWPGAPKARRALGFANGLSGSVGESRSRVAIARAGLPAPELQEEFCDAFGTHIGTVDFWWKKQRLIGEFDGLVKYGRLLKPGQSVADAVVAEKIREDALRDQDTRMARWLWTDLRPFTATAARLRDRLR
jgi:hypothetical protein